MSFRTEPWYIASQQARQSLQGTGTATPTYFVQTPTGGMSIDPARAQPGEQVYYTPGVPGSGVVAVTPEGGVSMAEPEPVAPAPEPTYVSPEEARKDVTPMDTPKEKDLWTGWWEESPTPSRQEPPQTLPTSTSWFESKPVVFERSTVPISSYLLPYGGQYIPWQDKKKIPSVTKRGETYMGEKIMETARKQPGYEYLVATSHTLAGPFLLAPSKIISPDTTMRQRVEGAIEFGTAVAMPFLPAKVVYPALALSGAYGVSQTWKPALKGDPWAQVGLGFSALSLGVGAYGTKKAFWPTPVEEIYQPRWNKYESYSAGEVREFTGRRGETKRYVDYRGTAKSREVFGVYQDEVALKGRGGKLGEFQTGFQFLKSRKAGEFRFAVTQDIIVPEMGGIVPLGDTVQTKYGQTLTGKITSGVPAPTGKADVISIWDVYKGKSYFEIPTGKWFGGYGVVPDIEVGIERVSGLTIAKSKTLGEPAVVKEWKVSPGAWYESDIDYMTMRTKTGVAGVSVTAEDIQPFIGKSTMDISSEVMQVGGGGKAQQFVSPRGGLGFESLGGVSFTAPSFAKQDIGVISVLPWFAAYDTGKEQEFYEEPTYIMPEVSEQFDVKTDTLKGAIKMPKFDIRFSTGLDTKVKSAQTQMQKQRIGTMSGTKMIQGLSSSSRQRLDQQMGFGTATRQLQQQQLGLERATMQKVSQLTLTTPSIPRISARPRIPLQKLSVSILPPKPRKRKIRKVKRIRTYKYTPTVVGIATRKPIMKAPKRITTGAVGIRAPLSPAPQTTIADRVLFPSKKKKKKGLLGGKWKKFGKSYFGKLGVKPGKRPKLL